MRSGSYVRRQRARAPKLRHSVQSSLPKLAQSWGGDVLSCSSVLIFCSAFFCVQAEDGIRDYKVTGVQTCALPIIASLSKLQGVLVLGSNLRKDHPLFAQRIRQAAKQGCAVLAINERVYDWAMPVTASIVAAPDWAQALADVAAAEIGRASCRERV